jgi:MFS family permease
MTAAYAKVTWRLIPFLFLCYIAAYLDRVNVGFAKLQMLAELQFSEAVYGLGAGIFFIGYFIFEVPSNVLMHEVGARKWIARIMISWGIVSALTMLVRTPVAFYAMRFILGIVEAGFFPGIILYLTYWYPAARRARMTALFMLAVPVTGIVGGPLSGWILDAFGWKALFVIEAIPSVVLGALAFVRLDDRIRDATWLTTEEKAYLEAAIERERTVKAASTTLGVFKNPRVWLASAIYFGLVMGLYGVTFWLPTLIKNMGIARPLHVGLLSTIPYSAAAIAMALVARSSDASGERRWHVALPAIAGGLGLVASGLAGSSTFWGMAALTVATAGILASLPVFWSLPTALLEGSAAAAGIALVNSLGNLAGFVSPYLVGFLKDATGKTTNGLYMIAVSLFAAAVLTLGTSTWVGRRPTSL